MIASFALIVSSCSKSSGDLAANENAAKASVVNNSKTSLIKPKSGNPLSGPIIGSQWSQLYPFINQPYDLELGDNGATINSGQLAVFYVTLSPDVANEIPVSATLTTVDDATGLPIETFNLISYRDAGTVDAIIPDALVGTPFMFAMVNLGTQYIGKTVTLHSDIEFNGGFSPAQLNRAFTVTQ
jgi:hypothetical protein